MPRPVPNPLNRAPRRAKAPLLTLCLALSPLSGSATEWPLAESRRDGASTEQVSAIGQFSDVRPSDWAYQALANLIERYGCVEGYPDGTFRGQRTLTRFEAAAALNACLDRVTELTDELKRLTKEFDEELALLGARVDGLEARVGELEATRFSTTTKLGGQATVVLGANSFGGTARELVGESQGAFGATSLNTDLQLTLDTSFTGKDLLRVNLRAGNFGLSSFGGAGPSTLSQLEVAFEEDLGDPFARGSDVVAIDRLFYQFPVGEFKVSVGGRVAQEDMLEIWPSVYPDDTVLDVLSLPGSPAAYNKNLGAGAGLSWRRGGFAISANYVAANGDGGDPAEGGIATDGAAGTGTAQIGYSAERWALAALYSRVQNGDDLIVYGTNFTLESFRQPGATQAFALSGYWQPLSPGWLPSLSAGWGLNTTSYDRSGEPGEDRSALVRVSQSWSVGVQWLDAFLPGNALGVAVGQPTFATRLEGGATPRDGHFVWEGWYKVQLTDAISLTPAVFYLSRPLGQATPEGESFRQLGGLLKTTVRF